MLDTMTIFILVLMLPLVALTMLSTGFPIAAYLGKNINFEYRSKYFNTSRGWENQELVYGFFHWIALWYVIFKNLI